MSSLVDDPMADESSLAQPAEAQAGGDYNFFQTLAVHSGSVRCLDVLPE